MKGYFAIGIERASKPMNTGNLMRSAHAFGAAFIFTVEAHYRVREARSDTSKTPHSVPWYDWSDIDAMELPKQCSLVGVELTDEAVDLPSFTHPRCAAYVMGPERGDLSAAMRAKCDHLIRIPTRFCVNVQIAGAIVMYDRLQSLGQFSARPIMPGGEKGVQFTP
ncbi:MAG: RNA methyltransferase [PS1 clade bacterium]|uniref:RNA methyltransferase n=1 Tax=PS1 clade bacterium TaxID=2175152 RepID=A0A937L4Q0_9PROT|nr:RNA methyltransferase [PS1 clade bacterium]